MRSVRAAFTFLFICFNVAASEPLNRTADLLVELLRANTSNPPGNEASGNEASLDEVLASKFRPPSFEIDIFPTPQAGKAHFNSITAEDLTPMHGNDEQMPVN